MIDSLVLGEPPNDGEDDVADPVVRPAPDPLELEFDEVAPVSPLLAPRVDDVLFSPPLSNDFCQKKIAEILSASFPGPTFGCWGGLERS